MSMLAVCVILAVAGQGWDKPVIQEAELAPPAGMSEAPAGAQATPAPSAQPGASQDVESAPPADTPSSEAPRELQWEYDDDGRPVARPAAAPKAAETPEPKATPKAAAPVVKSQPKQEQPSSSSRGSRHVATFWFVLPK